MQVIVTGANRGIGLGLTTQLAKRDQHHVFATARFPNEAGDLRGVADATGSVSVCSLELTDESSIVAFAAHVAAETGRVDLLIHNAGTMGAEVLDELTLSGFAQVFAANVFGAAVLTRHVRPLLGPGSLVVVIASRLGSIALADGRLGFPYRMSKSALNMFARQLSIQLKPEGIGVLALSPGNVQTRMNGYEGQIDVETSCLGILRAIDGFVPELSGAFVRYDGSTLPW